MKSADERRHLIETRKVKTDLTERLFIRDEWRNLEVVKVPVDALALNADNRRFRAERLWAEEQLGRSLDPENNPDDELSVETLLLDVQPPRVESGRLTGTPTSDSKALADDWVRRGQASPLWIRPDGTVRNGNRRLAMVKRLQREKGDTGIQWVNAVVLPLEDVDEATLLEMEQREQLTENFKVRYNDIDYLLALREAAVLREIEWYDSESLGRVAGELQGMVEKSKSEVTRDLYAIKYMDAFLRDSGQEGEYHKVLRKLERFRDIGRTMSTVESDYPDEADDILRVLFAGVRANITHNDIRKIREMIRKDRERFTELAEKVKAAEKEAGVDEQPPRVVDAGTSGAASDEEDEEDQDEEEDFDDEGEQEGRAAGPVVPNYPKKKVGSAFKVAIDGFDSRHKDVLQILQEVTNRTDVLSSGGKLEGAAAGDSEGATAVRAALRLIIEWVDDVRSLIE